MHSGKQLAVICVWATMLAVSARADTVGTGTFTVDIDNSGGLPAPYSGSITFDNTSRTVFGTPNVNLSGANPVSVLPAQSHVLTYQSSTPPASGTYDTGAQSSPATLLTFTGTGNFVAIPNTTNGSSFVGPLNALTGTVLNGLPAACPANPCLAYTLDGATTCCFGAGCTPPVPANIQRCTGMVALNAFQPMNTMANGNNDVSVTISGTYFDSRRNTLVSGTLDVTYIGGVTMTGNTTVTAVSNAPGATPADFQFDVGGFETTFFELTTDTGPQGSREVCVHYDSADGQTVDGTNPPVNVGNLALLHYNSATGSWDAPPTSVVDQANKRVCVTVTTFSPFALAVREVGLIPPDAGALGCEAKIAKSLGSLAGQLAKCLLKSANAAFKSRAFDEAQCEADAKAKYDHKTEALTGCPACANGNRAILRDRLQASLDALSPQAFCAGSIPFGF